MEKILERIIINVINAIKGSVISDRAKADNFCISEICKHINLFNATEEKDFLSINIRMGINP